MDVKHFVEDEVHEADVIAQEEEFVLEQSCGRLQLPRNRGGETFRELEVDDFAPDAVEEIRPTARESERLESRHDSQNAVFSRTQSMKRHSIECFDREHELTGDRRRGVESCRAERAPPAKRLPRPPGDRLSWRGTSGSQSIESSGGPHR